MSRNLTPKLKLRTSIARDIYGGIAWVQIGGCVGNVTEEQAAKIIKAVEWFRKQLERKLKEPHDADTK